MIDAKGSSRHPLGQLAYRIISGNVWYDARIVLEDQKVGCWVKFVAFAMLIRGRGRSVTTSTSLLEMSSGSRSWQTFWRFQLTMESCAG